MNSSVYPWFEKVWRDLISTDIPHAILLHGQRGIGKLDFALTLSKRILCESSSDVKPCNHCDACYWFDKGSHPDFIGILPESLQNLMPLSNLSDEGSKVDKKKIANDEPSSESTDKKQSQFIKVEAIRETLDSLGKGAYRSNKKIVLIYPLESLQAVSSNALLKSLEEPADTTLFILITSRIDKILPTIKSRCRQIAMPRPTESVAIDWLVSQLAVANIKLSREELLKDLYESGRSPLTAWVHISQQEDKYQSESKITLIDALSKGDEINWLDTADKVFKLPMPEILLIIERWVSDLLIVKLTNKNFYYPNYHTSMQGCLNGVNIHKLTNYWKKLIECKRHELHPLSSKLQIEALLLDYRNIFKS